MWGTYRKFFANVSRYLKLSNFCKDLNIAPSNLSSFIKYGSSSLSIDKVRELYNYIIKYCENIE